MTEQHPEQERLYDFCSCGTRKLKASHRCRDCTAPAKRFARGAARSTTNECIEWPFSRLRGEYGRIGDDGRSSVTLAHRYVYRLAYGIDPGSSWVLHHCDNPPCVNPRHLFLGDRQANTDDMLAKARQSRGEPHPSSKLTSAEVREIRCLHEGGVGQRELARRFGVTLGTIQPILSRRTWAHV